MKTKFKLLSFLLVLTVLLGALAGCGPKEPKEEPSAPADVSEPAPAEDKEDAEAKEPAGPVAVLKLKTIGGKPKDLEMVQKAINEYIGPKINAAIEFEYFDWGDYSDQMSRILNTGGEWDLAFGSGIAGIDEFVQNGQTFADLAPMLEEVPALYESMPKGMWEGVTYKGTVFGVPANKDTAAAQFWVWDKRVVEEANIDYENIITFSDLEAGLKAAKELEPNRYPLHMNKDGINSMQLAWFETPMPVSIRFGDTKVVNIYKEPDMVEGFKLLRKWYEAGYINPDANTTTQDQIPRGAQVVFSAQGWPEAVGIWSDVNGYPVVVKLRAGPSLTTEAIRGSFMVINKASEHVLEALKYLELLNTDKYLRNLVAYGIEGVHWKKAGGKENTYIKLGDEVENEDGSKSVRNGYEVPAYSQGSFMPLLVPEGTSEDQWINVGKQNENADVSELIGFVFDYTEVENEWAALEEVTKKYHSNLMTGAGKESVEDILENLYADQEKAGIDRVIEVMQKHVDEFIENKK